MASKATPANGVESRIGGTQYKANNPHGMLDLQTSFQPHLMQQTDPHYPMLQLYGAIEQLWAPGLGAT